MMPTVEHIVSGDRVAGEPGSSEWNGLAVDRQITDPALVPVREDRLDPGDLRWDVSLEPGQHVLALSLTGTGRGDVTTYFGTDVRPAQRP
jgi:hypothetical protein